MSRSAAIVAVLFAAALALVAAALLIPQRVGVRAALPGQALLDVDPGRVVSLRVRRPGATRESVVERTPTGGWTFRFEHDDGAVTSEWPVTPSRARGAVRVLADLRAVAEPTVGAGLPDEALVVRIGLDSGLERVLRFDPRPVGGTCLVEAPDAGDGAGRLAFVEDSVRRALMEPGPRGWRSPSALPGVGAEVSRITLRSDAGELALARVEGRWALRAPAPVRADDAAVRSLIDALTALTIERFVEGADALAGAPTGLDPPALLIECETDRRLPAPGGETPTVGTDRRTLAVGAPADMSGETRFATPDGGRTLLIVRAGTLLEIAAAPIDFAARTATAVDPSNVGGVMIAGAGGFERGLRRGVDGWVEMPSGGGQQPADGEGVEVLLAFLHGRRAQGGASFEAPQGWREAGAVVLLDFDGGVLDRVTIGSAGGPPGGAPAVRTAAAGGSGGLHLVYNEAPALLREAVGLPAPAGR